MRFFGLGFFMESSPYWALIIILKQFHVLSTRFRVITQFKISPHWLSARELFPRTGSVRRNYFPELAQYAGIIPPHWLSAQELFPRTGSVRRNYFSALASVRRNYFSALAKCPGVISPHLTSAQEYLPTFLG